VAGAIAEGKCFQQLSNAAQAVGGSAVEYVYRGFAVDQETGNLAVDAGDGDVAGFGVTMCSGESEFVGVSGLFGSVFSCVKTSDIKGETAELPSTRGWQLCAGVEVRGQRNPVHLRVLLRIAAIKRRWWHKKYQHVVTGAHTLPCYPRTSTSDR